MNIEQVYCPAVRCTIYAAAAAGCDVSMDGLAIVFLAFQWLDYYLHFQNLIIHHIMSMNVISDDGQ